MRGAFRAVVAGTVLLVPSARGEVAAPETTEVFLGREAGAVSHALAHRFVLSRSEVVLRNGKRIAPEVDYRLDADAGLIALPRPLAQGEELAVRYSWVPLDLPRDFRGLSPGEPTPPDSTHMAVPAAFSTGDRLARVVDENLVIGGAKTLAIEVGSNKDATIEQSLRVSVTGKIGEDVRLTALLSDQNIPLQPEGNTQRLEELDEVLIRIDAPRGSATLGDFVARRDGRAFGNFERRLSGAQGLASVGPGGVRAIGATARGNFRSVEFPGEEGKQGPYVLAGSGLNPTGVIVAGSERVWVDGVLLTRGENKDYVIDYSRGEIEFTNRRLVTEDSEIAVDFEIAEQEYPRNFYFGEGTYASADGGLEWSVSVASEVDGDDPLSITLTDERRATLEQAGDSPVLVPGAICGVENGDYVKRTDGQGVEFFEFAGRDSGDCDVSFTFVGAGLGDYVRDRDPDTGLTFFRFVGDGLGDFAPGLRLAAPRTSTLADVALRLRAGREFALEADGAVSREDRNTLSSLDDDDNDGAAGKVALRWEKEGWGALGSSLRLRTTGSLRREEAGFRSLGRTRDPYLGEVWNFADTTRADEAVSEVNAVLENPDRWSLGGAFGVLDRAGLFRSTRREGSVNWRGARVRKAFFRVESVRRENDPDSAGTVTGDLLRERGEVRGRLWMLRPGGTFWKEEREDVRGGVRLSGEDDVEGAVLLGIEPSSSLRADLRFARRITNVVQDGAWTRKSVGRTWEVKAEARPRRSLRARVSWIRRELGFAAGRPEANRTTQLTRADLQHEGVRGLVSGEYVYETTTRFFSDLLAGQETGEEPTLALNASARIRLGGSRRSRRGEEGKPSGFARVLGLLRSETFARVEEETTSEDRTRIQLLDFSRFQDDARTVFGKILLREEVTLFPGAGPFSLTARWERIDTEDNRTDPARVELLTERTVLRARNRIGTRWTLESQGAREKDSRSDSGTGRVDFDIWRSELREELVYQPGPRVRVSGRGAFVTERNEAIGASIRGISFGLASTLTVSRQGRFRGDLDWTHPTSARGRDAGSRFRTKGGDQIEWRTSLELRVADWMNASISYSGRALEDVPTTHFARAEARALF